MLGDWSLVRVNDDPIFPLHTQQIILSPNEIRIQIQGSLV